MSDNVEIKTKLSVTGDGSIKNLGRAFAELANEAAKTEGVIGEFDKILGVFQKRGVGVAGALEAILTGTVAASDAARKYAAALAGTGSAAAGEAGAKLKALAIEYLNVSKAAETSADVQVTSARKTAEAEKRILEEVRETLRGRQLVLNQTQQLEDEANRLRLEKEEFYGRLIVTEHQKQQRQIIADELKASRERAAIAKQESTARQQNTKDVLDHNRQVYNNQQQSTKDLLEYNQQVFNNQEKERKVREREEAKQESAERNQRRRTSAALAYPIFGNHAGAAGYIASAVGSFVGEDGGSGGGLSGIGSLIGDLGPLAISLTTAAGSFTLAGKGAYDLVKSTAAEEQELSNLADRMGTSIGTARELSIATRLVGVDMTALQQAGRSLTAAIEGTEGGSKAAGDALAKLGVRSRDSAHDLREPEAVMSEVLAKLSQISNPTERIRIANEVLGRSGKAFLPLIGDYDALMAKSKELADQLPENLNKAMTGGQRSIVEFETTFHNLKEELALSLAPIVLKVVGDFSGFIKQLRDKQELADANSDSVKQRFGRLGAAAYDTLALFNPEAAHGIFGEQTLNLPELLRPTIALAQKDGHGRQSLADADKEKAIEFKKSLGTSQDEGELRTALDAAKKERTEAIKANSDIVNTVDAATRQSNNKIIDDSSKSIKNLEARLKALKPEGVNEIANALRRIHTEADAAQASLVSGSDATTTKLKDEITFLRSKGATLAQIAAATADLNRIEAANAEKETRDRNRERARNSIRLSDQQFRLASSLENHSTRHSGDETEADVNGNFEDQISQSASLRKQQIDTIKRLGDLYGNPKEQQNGIDTAVSEEAGRNLDAYYAKLKAVADLKDRERVKAQADAERLSKGLEEQGRRSADHEYEQDSKAAEQILRARSRSRGGLETDLNGDRSFRLQQSQEVYQKDLADIALLTDGTEKILAENQALIDLKQRDRDTEREHLLEVIELTQQVKEEQQESVRKDAGDFFDIITGRDAGRNIGKFFQEQARGVGRTVFGNVAAQIFPHGFGTDQLVAGQTTTDADGTVRRTGIGEALRGTFLGVNPKKVALDNAKNAPDSLTSGSDKSLTASTTLTQALNRLEATIDKWASGRGYASSPVSAAGRGGNFFVGGNGGAPGSSAGGGIIGVVGGGGPSSPAGDSIGSFISGAGGATINVSGGSGSTPNVVNLAPGTGGSSSSSTYLTTGDSASDVSLPLTSLSSLPRISLPNLDDSAFSGGSSGSASSGSSAEQRLNGVSDTLGKVGSLIAGTSTSSKIADGAKTAPGLFNSISQIFGGAGSTAANGQAFNTLFRGGTYSPSDGGGNDNFTAATGAQQIGAGLDIAAAGITGTLGVLSGLKEGGGQGITKAIGSGSLAVASVDPDPLTKSILTAVGLGSEFASALFGDPRTNFQNKETSDLERNRYLSPVAINNTEDSSGNIVSFDQFGQARSTGIQNNYQIPVPYIKKYKDNYYEVDGSVLNPTQSGYKATNQTQQAVTIQIQALDSQSFMDHSDDIGNALNKALIDGHSVGNQVANTVLGGS